MLTERIPRVIERRLIGGGTVIREYRISEGQKKKQPVAGIHVDWGQLEKLVKYSIHLYYKIKYNLAFFSKSAGRFNGKRVLERTENTI